MTQDARLSGLSVFFLCVMVVCSVLSLEFAVKKEKWQGAGTRQIKFLTGGTDVAFLKPSGKALTVTIAQGRPKNTRKYH